MEANGRTKVLNDRETAHGRYVLYWMQASQRAADNDALLIASAWANKLGLPLVVFFGLKQDYPEANLRHFKFMLEGLAEIQSSLEERGIAFIVRKADPWSGAVDMASDAAIAVCDRGYLKHQREWRARFASEVKCPVLQVEADAVVPVEAASGTELPSAGVLRRRISSLLHRYLKASDMASPEKCSSSLGIETMDIADIDRVMDTLRIDRSVGASPEFKGGSAEAERRLDKFIEERLPLYGTERNDPSGDVQSDLGPYLHFGQISPVHVALRALGSLSEGAGEFIDQLIVRRELSFNFVLRNPNYDTFEGLPRWARETLLYHSRDRREHVYELPELEGSRTHDPYWNAAQKEMVLTGKMHGYMRMYWGKKVLEWSKDPREAFATLVHLNNKYSLDGRDPNSYTGVAWCFGKHDRPFKERAVFGKVRYMNDRGLERKFDMGAYLARVGSMGLS